MQVTKANTGFSLLEVVVAVAVIALILLSIALLSTKSLQIVQTAQMKQKAVILAREGIEKVRNDREMYPWGSFLSTYLPEYPTLDNAETLSGNFTRWYVITREPVGAGATPSYVDIECFTKWTDSKGDHTVSQKTKLTRWL